MTETSLSKKGYTLLKNELSKSELSLLKKMMTIKPFINQDYGMPAESFPIYLENKSKIYLPKYYGNLTYVIQKLLNYLMVQTSHLNSKEDYDQIRNQS